jgi:hypothetical protein
MSETDDYLDRPAEFDQANAEVNALARDITSVGTALMSGRGRFCFSNCPAGLPAEAVMSRNNVSVDANNWKNPQQIMALLARGATRSRK